MERALYAGGVVVGGVRAAGGGVAALSDNAAAGLILGGGALGCGLLVLGLTVLAVRRGARAEQDERAAQRVVAGAVGQRRPGRPSRNRGRGGRADAGTDTPHDPYPPQPYSAREPRSHQPYSRPYKVPRQEQYGKTNGHRPPDSTATGIPTTPYSPPTEDES